MRKRCGATRCYAVCEAVREPGLGRAEGCLAQALDSLAPLGHGERRSIQFRGSGAIGQLRQSCRGLHS